MKTLKERITHALKLRGATQLALASAAGVKAPSVNGWITGETTDLKAAPALRAARFLKVRPWWLVFGDGPIELDGEPQFESSPAIEPNIDWRAEAFNLASGYPQEGMRNALEVFCGMVDAHCAQKQAKREQQHTPQKVEGKTL